MVQYSMTLDASFGAVADGTRRGILERLGRGEATVTELATAFGITLTGIKKHLHVLEAARLVTTRKLGRVRRCRLGPRRLAQEAAWITRHQNHLDEQFDRLDALLDRTKEDA